MPYRRKRADGVREEERRKDKVSFGELTQLDKRLDLGLT